MFSYRHAFHAGNHADVLKHLVLIQVMEYLKLKDPPLHLVDTHAGAGLYRLDKGYATVSEEAAEGVFKLWEPALKQRLGEPVAPAIQAYLDLLASVNTGPHLRVYPGSPFIMQSLMRAHDQLKLFELHPSDIDLLVANMAQVDRPQQISIQGVDGFNGLKGCLPPVSRRGLILMDPSYEDKKDYVRVFQAVTEGIRRFLTGTYLVWYPVLPRIDAQELPERMRRLKGAQGPIKWLDVRLRIKAPDAQDRRLIESGVFVINPPWTLKAQLQEALPQLKKLMALDDGARTVLVSSEDQ